MLSELELHGESVSLLPLRMEHADALSAAAADGRLWELWYTFVPSPEQMSSYIEQAQADQQAGTALAFAVLDRASHTIVGSTRFCHADSANRRVEIGYTWYGQRFQRSAVNSECKLLLLTHAFEVLDAIAVEFRTHWHNHASRAAIARLGAKQDGVLRNHQLMPGGDIVIRWSFQSLTANGQW